MDNQNNVPASGQQTQQVANKSKRDPVKMALRNYAALALIYIIVGLLFYSTKPETSYFVIPTGIFLIIVAYLLSKRMKAGIYLGWIVVALAVVGAVYAMNILQGVIAAYIAYWHYKAHRALIT